MAQDTESDRCLELHNAASSIGRDPAALDGISEELVRIATAYATVRSSLHPDPIVLAEASHDVGLAVRAVTETISDEPGIALWFKRQVRDAIDDARLAEIQRVLTTLGIESGRAQGRVFKSDVVKQHAEAIKQHREQNSDLFHRFPDLQKKSDEIFQRAVGVGMEQLHRAEKDAIVCSKALGFIPSRFSQIERLLGSCDTARLELLEKAFEERYKVTLKEKIRTAYNHPLLRSFQGSAIKRSRLLHLVERDQVKADADKLALITKASRKKLASSYVALLRPANAEQISETEADFRQRYQRIAVKFEQKLDKLTPLRKERYTAAYVGNSALADAIAIHEVLFKKSSVLRMAFDIIRRGSIRRARGLPISATLENGDAKAIGIEYAKRFGVPLRQQVSNRLGAGAWKDRVVSAVEGDMPRHDAAVLRCAFENHDGVKIGGIFLGKDETVRQRRIAAYEANYGDFEKSFRKFLNKTDQNFLRPIIKTGELNREETIYRCVVGMGADEKGIIRCLRGLTAIEVVDLEHKYTNLIKQRFGKLGNLRQRLRWECSGDSRYDIEQHLKGAPPDAAETAHRLQRQLRYERSGWIKRTDFITKEGAIMESDVAAATRFYKDELENKPANPEAEKRFKMLSRLAQRDFTAFRAVKNEIATLISNISAGVAGFVTVFHFVKAAGGFHHLGIISSGGLEHIGKIAVYAFAAGVTARFLMKRSLKGASYGREEIIKDFAISCIEGGSFLLSGFLSGDIARRLVNFSTKVGLKQVVQFSGKLDQARLPAHNLSTKDLQRSLEEDDRAYLHWWDQGDMATQ